MQVEVIPSQPEHVEPIARRMRFTDAMEVYFSGRHTPSSALSGSRQVGESRTALMDGVPFLMFGVSSFLMSDFGRPWMLATNDIQKVTRQFIRECAFHLDEVSQGIQRMENHVYARNEVSIRWLQWLGFQIEDARPYGPFGQPFRRFWKNV